MSNVYKIKVPFTFSVTLDEDVKLHELSALEWFEVLSTICQDEYKAQLLEALLNRSNWYAEIT